MPGTILDESFSDPVTQQWIPTLHPPQWRWDAVAQQWLKSDQGEDVSCNWDPVNQQWVKTYAPSEYAYEVGLDNNAIPDGDGIPNEYGDGPDLDGNGIPDEIGINPDMLQAGYPDTTSSFDGLEDLDPGFFLPEWDDSDALGSF